MMTRSTLIRSTSWRTSQLKLLVKGQAIVELTGRVFARFGHFFHQFFRFDDGFQDFALVGFAQHSSDEHFKQNQERFVQGKDEIEFAYCIKYLFKKE